MKTVIYMNHRIREKVPSGPVIRVTRGRSVRDTDEVTILVGGRVIGRVVYDPENNPSSSHEVKAWVELADGVEVVLKPAVKELA